MRRSSIYNLLLSIIFVGILGFVVWWMSDNVVWLGDDLDYKYRMKGAIWQSWGEIKTWDQYLKSQLIHYHNVNGRFVAHALVQLFNGVVGQNVFALCNAIVYMLFAIELARCGLVRFGYNFAGSFIAICLSVICFVTKMMPTCQIGYIWGMLVNLVWISAFFSRGKKKWSSVIIMIIAGIIVGNWQESISIGVCAGLGVWWLSQFFDRDTPINNHFDWRRSWIILGYFIGTATNCLSPSTLSRVETVANPLIDQLLVTSYSVSAVLLLLLAAIILGIRKKLSISFTFNFKNGKIPDGFLITAIVFLLLFNAAIGIYSNRQLFGANLFAIVLLLKMLPRHRLNIFFNTIAGLSTIGIFIVMYEGVTEVNRQYEEITEMYQKSEDGVVEYDRVRVLNIGHPSDAKYYEDIVGQFDNDLHHSMMKDFYHRYRGRTLKLKPTTTPDTTKIEQYAPGHFYVTIREPNKDKGPAEVTAYGHYSILGLFQIKATPRKLKIDKYSRRRKPFATAVIIPEYPLFAADSISI